MQEFYPQLKVACLKNGAPVEITDLQHHNDCTVGYAGKFSPPDRVELIITISPLGRGSLWCAIEGRGQGPVVRKKDKSEAEEQRIFSKVVRIHKNFDDPTPPFSRYPENHFRILEVRGSYLRHFEVALITQKGHFYVSKQLTREGSLYGDGEIIFPPFAEWPEMTDFLTGLVGMRGVKKIESFIPPLPPAPNGIKNFQGRVLWWNMAQQFGAILLRNESTARVHRSNLKRSGNRLAYLVADEVVKFERLVIPKQITGRSTTFSQEAETVRLA